MRLLDRRVRGFRLVDLVALGLLTVLILGVYLAKTMAGRERAQIASVERQISAEKARIRLLTAEVSHLEQPSRIERLSTAYLGMAPVPEKREATAETLIDVARNRAGPAPATAPAPAAAAPAADDEQPVDEPPDEAPR
jgi:cell division protein FtsL